MWRAIGIVRGSGCATSLLLAVVYLVDLVGLVEYHIGRILPPEVLTVSKSEEKDILRPFPF